MISKTDFSPTNSTDATMGEPLAARAKARREELVNIQSKLGEDRKTEASDLQLAIDTVDGLLTGDPTQLTETTSSDLNRWLEETKHLGERAKA